MCKDLRGEINYDALYNPGENNKQFAERLINKELLILKIALAIFVQFVEQTCDITYLQVSHHEMRQ